MHDSADNQAPMPVNSALRGFSLPPVGTQFNGKGFLLKGSDASSTCLNCHAATASRSSSYSVMTYNLTAGSAPANMTPGGDFAWLNISTVYVTSTGTVKSNPGTSHGHAVVAQDYGLTGSSVYPTAPGGGTYPYPSNKLSCTSCHDPHGTYRVNNQYQVVRSGIGQNAAPIIGSGSYGSMLPSARGNGGAGEALGVYRLLAGAGYAPPEVSGNFGLAFLNPPPFAFSPRVYNRAESATDTRVAYGSGMSQWCMNCHPNMHGNADAAFQHPPGNGLGQDGLLANADYQGSHNIIASNYNAYLYSGNLSGTQSTSYTSLVPYEEGLQLSSSNYAALASHAVSDGSYQAGPSGTTEQVMCLTCHRAHASGWPHSLRWNAPNAAYLTIQGAYPGIDAANSTAQNGEYNLGYTQAQVQRTFYDRSAAVYGTNNSQTQLCGKCHS